MAVIFAVMASLCTATSSVCQRLGAEASEGSGGFEIGIVFRLARQPIWLLGLASMILGFVFQVTALHYGDLALVQPILGTELLFVFGYMSIIGSRRVKHRDWLAVVAMAAGLGTFLLIASPAGGRTYAPGGAWVLAGLVTIGAVALAVVLASRRGPGGASRRAAMLGAGTGIAWGFVAGVTKELSSHLGAGAGGLLTNWSPYVLVGAGAVSMILASHAMSAGPLAASQPGFTLVDPITASLLGFFLFHEHIQLGALSLAGETAALLMLVGGVVILSHSQLVAPQPDADAPAGDVNRTSPPPASSPDVPAGPCN